MKNAFLFLVLLFGNTLLFSQIKLDKAIGEAAKDIESRLDPKTVVAVVNFDSESVKMANYVIDEINRNLVKNNVLKVVDRKHIDSVMGELNFQMSGFISDESFQGIGQMLGAESLITGSIEKVDRVYRFRIKTTNVKTAQIQSLYTADVENDNFTAGLMGGSANLFGLSDYTPAERTGAFALNLIPFPCLGSWFMGDTLGGVIGTGLQLAGLGMVIGGALWTQNPDRKDYTGSDGSFDQSGYDKASNDMTTGGYVLLGSGLVVWAGGYIFGLIRPYMVHKPQAEVADAFIDNIGIAFVPWGKEPKVMLSYKTSF